MDIQWFLLDIGANRMPTQKSVWIPFNSYWAWPSFFSLRRKQPKFSGFDGFLTRRCRLEFSVRHHSPVRPGGEESTGYTIFKSRALLLLFTKH